MTPTLADRDASRRAYRSVPDASRPWMDKSEEVRGEENENVVTLFYEIELWTWISYDSRHRDLRWPLFLAEPVRGFYSNLNFFHIFFLFLVSQGSPFFRISPVSFLATHGQTFYSKVAFRKCHTLSRQLSRERSTNVL